MSVETQSRWVLLAPGSSGAQSGGHTYNRRLCANLTELGQPIDLQYLPGQYPHPDASTTAQAEQMLNAIPVGSVVIVDGLAYSALPDLMHTQAQRLHIFALVHLPLADEAGLSSAEASALRTQEATALAAATGVITTSAFCADRLSADYKVARHRIRSVPPGVDLPERIPQPHHSPPFQLLCVGNVIPRKGQDVLVAALGKLVDLPWQCTLVGSLTQAPDYAAEVQQQISTYSLHDRIVLTGSVAHQALAEYYRQADVFVLPSLFETYGMVVTEALAYGLPVVSTTGGALADTLPEGTGLRVPPNDAAALAQALRDVLSRPETRDLLTMGAQSARQQLSTWTDTAVQFRQAIHAFLHRPLAEPHPGLEREQFSDDWLGLREPADQRARSGGLSDSIADTLSDQYPTAQALNLVDLGTGTGANVRYLAPRIQQALPTITQHWTLVEHDPALLTRAQQGLNQNMATLTPLQADLRALDKLSWPPEGVYLVTASALLDIVSADWMYKLARMCAHFACPVLFTLTYDGRIEFSSPAPDDELIRDTVNAHQQGEGAFGPCLGPTATAMVTQALAALGFSVQQASSPWLLTAEDVALQRALIRGWADACREQRPDLQSRITRWEQFRLHDLSTGEGQLMVGHQDVLALPPGLSTHAVH